MAIALLRRIKCDYPRVFYKYIRGRHWLRRLLISDKKFINSRYFKRHGVYPDLIHPRKYTEFVVKILASLPVPLKTTCADKFAVRDYVKRKVGPDILNDIYGVFNDYRSFRDSLDQLPDKFVLKATHGSGWNYICKDKTKIDENLLHALAEHWLKSNFYYMTRELVYKDIPPRIICEKYLEDDSGGLNDYKVYCFNGVPKFLHMVTGRCSNMIYNTYDTNGNYLDYDFMGCTDRNVVLNKSLPLNELLEYSRKLSSDFDYVRVDFYYVSGKIIFGELTFTPGSGNYGLPEQDDLDLGRYFSNKF